MEFFFRLRFFLYVQLREEGILSFFCLHSLAAIRTRIPSPKSYTSAFSMLSENFSSAFYAVRWHVNKYLSSVQITNSSEFMEDAPMNIF